MRKRRRAEISGHKWTDSAEGLLRLNTSKNTLLVNTSTLVKNCVLEVRFKVGYAATGARRRN